MKTILYIILFGLFSAAVIIGGDYFYDVYNSPVHSPVKSLDNVNNNQISDNTEQHADQKQLNNQPKIPHELATDKATTSSVNSKTKLTKLTTMTPPHFKQGFDWSLPSYAGEERYSGLTTELDSGMKTVKNRFLKLLWNEANPQKGVFDFSGFERDLKRIAPQRALVRIEVNSSCEAPDWALKNLRQTSEKSLIYWDEAYTNALRPFIQAFARLYASNPQVIGVQLGLADGEFGKAEDSCDDYGNKNGWGEFWMSPNERNEAEQSFGFNPEVFEQATLANIDIYAKAFGKHKNKLGFTNLGTLFTYGDGAEPYNQKLKKIAKYVLDLGLGNRDGAIERWLTYTDKIYGNVFTSMPDGSCRLDFNERFASKIKGRYWGTENEFYGENDYVIAEVGPYENNPYRFLITSLRVLQMRRNFMSISNMSKVYDGDYKTQDFIKYLTLTLGKQLENTPDAYVLLGERYIANSRLKDHSEVDCVSKNKNSVTVRSFGRWLEESPQNTRIENKPAIKVTMPKSENYWFQGYYLPDGIDYEYFAREAKEFSFDVNDELAKMRCPDGCDVEVKAIFKDTAKTTLSVEIAEGVSQNLETLGDNKIKTATFTLNSRFSKIKQGSDLVLRSGQQAIPLIMLRMNLL